MFCVVGNELSLWEFFSWRNRHESIRIYSKDKNHTRHERSRIRAKSFFYF